MLNSEDAISSIVEKMAWGDIKYDPERYGKDGKTQKTRYSYRNQCIIWAIKTYVYNNSEVRDYSLDFEYENDGPVSGSFLASKIKEPHARIYDDTERKQYICKMIRDSGLTNTQKIFMGRIYICGYTILEAAQKYGVSRQNVDMVLKRAINNIKKKGWKAP